VLVRRPHRPYSVRYVIGGRALESRFGLCGSSRWDWDPERAETWLGPKRLLNKRTIRVGIGLPSILMGGGKIQLGTV
jgi:hypothetical protein